MNQTRPAQAAPDAAAALRILVVEDQDSDYDLLLRTVRKLGFRADATRVASERQMRDALARGTWNLVISDYNLPGFSALGALEILREAAPDVPFLLMSGAIGEEAAAEMMRAGADDFVPKDRPARLAHAIRRSLETAAERRERKRAEASLGALAANLPGVLFRLRSTVEGEALGFQYVSAGAEEIFGLSPEALTADAHRVVASLHAEDAEAFVASLRVAAAARAPWKGEFRVVAAGGAVRWIQVGASARADQGELAWDGLVTDITALKEAEARLVDTQAQLRKLSAHLERVKESERAAIAREVHDEIGGNLTAMRADISLLSRLVEPGAPARERLASLERLVSETQRSSQDIARSLRPVAIDHGLLAAVSWQAKDFEARHGVPCKVESNDPDLVLEVETATALFRILQESLTNIAKHAAATSVEVTLFSNARLVNLEIRDNGRGLSPAQLDKTDSYGVFGMNERVRNLGGWLEIDAQPGHGTTIMVAIPRLKAGAKP